MEVFCKHKVPCLAYRFSLADKISDLPKFVVIGMEKGQIRLVGTKFVMGVNFFINDGDWIVCDQNNELFGVKAEDFKSRFEVLAVSGGPCGEFMDQKN